MLHLSEEQFLRLFLGQGLVHVDVPKYAGFPYSNSHAIMLQAEAAALSCHVCGHLVPYFSDSIDRRLMFRPISQRH